MATGKYREAIPYLEKALESYSGDQAIQYSLGRAYMFQAKNIFENVYKKDPTSCWAHFFLAQTFEDQGKFELAIAEYKTVHRVNPNLPGAHEGEGNVYSKMKKFDEAEAEFKKELAIDPYNYNAVCKLAGLLI